MMKPKQEQIEEMALLLHRCRCPYRGGIGFDKSHLTTFQELDTKLRVAEHRAEVAEDELARHKRALRIAGDKFINEVCNMRGEDISDKCDYKCDTCFYDYYLQQAEKELAEERNNGTF